MKKTDWAIIIACGLAVIVTDSRADWKAGSTLYGISHHTDTPKAGKYNEKNWGAGGHLTYTTPKLPRAEFTVGAGGWHNSFNDPAYYLQAKATVRVFHRLRVGYDARTWASESYPAGIITYAVAEYGIDPADKLRIVVINKSAFVAGISYNF